MKTITPYFKFRLSWLCFVLLGTCIVVQASQGPVTVIIGPESRANTLIMQSLMYEMEFDLDNGKFKAKNAINVKKSAYGELVPIASSAGRIQLVVNTPPINLDESETNQRYALRNIHTIFQQYPIQGVIFTTNRGDWTESSDLSWINNFLQHFVKENKIQAFPDYCLIVCLCDDENKIKSFQTVEHGVLLDYIHKKCPLRNRFWDALCTENDAKKEKLKNDELEIKFKENKVLSYRPDIEKDKKELQEAIQALPVIPKDFFLMYKDPRSVMERVSDFVSSPHTVPNRHPYLKTIAIVGILLAIIGYGYYRYLSWKKTVKKTPARR